MSDPLQSPAETGEPAITGEPAVTGEIDTAPRESRVTFTYRRPEELDSGTRTHKPVVIVGAGPVGLTAAIDLSRRGIDYILLDDDDTVSVGSRAICYAKRTLEIWDRLNCGEVMLDKGITWNIGRVYFGDDTDPVYSFDLLPEEGHKFPAFINLQQYYSEEFLATALERDHQADMRFKSKVVGVDPRDDCVTLTVETPDGNYKLDAEYVIAADGFRSPIRQMMGLDFEGEVFKDHFLIADIKMKQSFPTERRFWFDPPFNRGESALIHKQPDDVWRLDFQLGWNINREEEVKPENVTPRIRAMLGDDVDFTYEWLSIYTFQCRQLSRFVHGRVIFAGDSAHLVSPFGARGANSGVQDADNLGWKLELVLKGQAPEALLESYNEERVLAARENILNSTRSTDFLTPKSDVSRSFRDAVLSLSKTCDFARKFVNSGRLSVPCRLSGSSLNTSDVGTFKGLMTPGTVCADAPCKDGGTPAWLLEEMGRHSGFILLYFAGNAAPSPDDLEMLEKAKQHTLAPAAIIVADKEQIIQDFNVLEDADGLITDRYDATPGTCYLIRPDHHVAARWRKLDPVSVNSALATATANPAVQEAANAKAS